MPKRNFSMKKQNTRRSLVANLTGRIITKIPKFYKKEEKKSISKFQKSINQIYKKIIKNKIAVKIQKNIIDPFPKTWNRIPNYVAPVFFFCIYILLWHPGWDAPKIPQQIPLPPKPKTIQERKNIYSSKDIIIEIQINSSTLNLYIKNKKILSFSIDYYLIQQDAYIIQDIQEIHGIIVLQSKNILCIMKKKSTNTSFQGSIINIDDDYWEIFFPYIHKWNNVIIH